MEKITLNKTTIEELNELTHYNNHTAVYIKLANILGETTIAKILETLHGDAHEGYTADSIEHKTLRLVCFEIDEIGRSQITNYNQI